MATAESTATTRGAVPGLAKIVGFLVCVELASGILQGYYTPIYQDIAGHLSIQDASVNWFEAAQLVVSALAVPFLARLGDLIGARNVLLLSTAVTALGSWVLAFAPGFTTFLIGFALQGAYVVWLPMEVAIVYRRTSRSGRQDHLTRRAAGILVGALELAVIIGAVTSGALVGATSMTVVLMIPAIVVTAVLVVIWFGIERDPVTTGGRVDLGGLALISLSIGLVMGGLIAIRLQGPGRPLGWLLIVVGLTMTVPFARYELGQTEPLVDVRLLASRLQWPVQLTAFLFGMSVLGAPTRTSPATVSAPARASSPR
jgi:MFS family permease